MALKMSLMLLTLVLLLIKEPTSAQSPIPPSETQNWTTCEEFLNNTVFDPDKVVDIDWKIFYFWNPDVEETYEIKFSRPTSGLIDRFKVELDAELKPPANWSNAELFMETTIDFSALFLRTLKPGIYRVIPSTAFEYHGAVPLLIFGLKLVEAGYLGIENCRYRICYALAPADKMPYHYELEKAARTLEFYSSYNRSHIWSPPPQPSDIPYEPRESDDDLDDDSEVEDPNRLNFF